MIRNDIPQVTLRSGSALALTALLGFVAVFVPTPSKASHHLSSATAQMDGRLNLTDVFVFPSPDGKSTVLVMNVSPDAGKTSPTTFHPDAVYDFNIDWTGKLMEDVRYRVRFTSAGTDGKQMATVYREAGAKPRDAMGDKIGQGAELGTEQPLAGGGRAWAGLAGDAFTAAVPGYFKFVKGVTDTGKADFSIFAEPEDTFAGRNVLSIVLEVPNAAFAKPDLKVWGTISLLRANEVKQVNRWGRPLSAFVFNQTPEQMDEWNASPPSRDMAAFYRRGADFLALVAKAARTTEDPRGYGERVAATLLPDALPYRVGTKAFFGFAGINGRALTDNTFDVFMTTVTNHVVTDHSLTTDTRADFPYVPPVRHSDLPAIIDRSAAPKP